MPATSGPCPIFKPPDDMRRAIFDIEYLNGVEKANYWLIAQRSAGQGPPVTPGDVSDDAASALLRGFEQAARLYPQGRAADQEDLIVGCALLLINALSSDPANAAMAAQRFIFSTDGATYILDSGFRLKLIRRLDALRTDFYGTELLNQLPPAPPNALFRSLWLMRKAIFAIETVPFNVRLGFWLGAKDLAVGDEVLSPEVKMQDAGKRLLLVFTDAAHSQHHGIYHSDSDRTIGLAAIGASAPQLIEALSPNHAATTIAKELFAQNPRSLDEPGRGSFHI